MNILIPLDGSQIAERSIEQAARFAQGAREPVRLILLRVVPLEPLTGAYSVVQQQARDVAVQAADEYLQGIIAHPTLQGLAVATHTETTALRVADAIIAQSKELHADLIIITSHGRSGIAHALLGSVAESIARAAPIPTLIVRAKVDAIAPVPQRPYTILVPLDGLLFAEHALASAAMIARAVGGQIVLFDVVPAPTLDAIHDREMLAKAEDYLEKIRISLVAQGIPAQVSLAPGERATQIVKRTQRETSPCDMIAMATHARQGVEKFFLGSVTDDVLRHAPCPLLVVHPQEA